MTQLIRWLTSNSLYILVALIALSAVYFSIRTYRALLDMDSETATPDGGHARLRFFRRIRTVLVIFVTILGVISIIFAVLKSRPVPIEPPDLPEYSFTVTVRLHDTLKFGDDLTLTLTDIKPQTDGATYRVWATVAKKDTQEMEIRNADESYAATYPREHGYSIKIVKASAESAKFSIAKNP